MEDDGRAQPGLGAAGPEKGPEEEEGLDTEQEDSPGPAALACPVPGQISWAALWGRLIINRKHTGTRTPSGTEGLWLVEATSVFTAWPVT